MKKLIVLTTTLVFLFLGFNNNIQANDNIGPFVDNSDVYFLNLGPTAPSTEGGVYFLGPTMPGQAENF